MKTELIKLFANVNVRVVSGKPSLYKPILILYALGQCHLKNERLINFKIIDTELSYIFKQFFPDEIYNNFHYSFGRLEKDGIWEVINSENLKRSSSGDLIRSELINNNVVGGFTKIIYDALIVDKDLIKEVCYCVLDKYIDKAIHTELLKIININHHNGNHMALISNEGEPVSRWWISKAIEIIKVDREIFSTPNMRRARLELIAGKNRLATIKGWMLAAQIIKNGRTSKEQELTNFGLAIKSHDSLLEKSSTWWAFHLATCFSSVSEPYSSFFLGLDTLSKDWISSKQLQEKVQNSLKQDNGEPYKDSTLESLLSSVRRMFVEDRPLEYLGLIETHKTREDGIEICLGSPKLTDEIIIHALAMMRFHRYKSRSTVDFSELKNDGLGHFLCCSPDQLRQQLRRMKQSNKWQDYFDFNEAVNLDSVSFAEHCMPDKTLLLLLQEGQDTWL
jgi:hypothetical protein